MKFLNYIGACGVVFLFLLLVTGGTINAQAAYTPIYDIQYTTDPSGDSPYKDQTDVTTEGIVTAFFANGYFIEDPAGGAWNGLFVYDTYNYPSLGDRVRLTGTVAEYYGLTELGYLTAFAVVSSANPLPAAVILASSDVSQEQWEGVLVRVENVTVADPDLGYGEWSVDDGSGPVVLDDKGSYTYSPAAGDSFSAIIGPLDYNYGAFKIQPRTDLDIIFPLDYTPIYDIQYTSDPSGDSPYKDQTDVTTEGIVTAFFANGYFIEDPAGGAWNGLFVYDPGHFPSIGDRLRLTGTVAEYYGLTELKNLSSYAVVSSDNPLPDSAKLATGDVSQEQWEGVLVRVENVTVIDPNLGFGEWSVDDGSGIVILDDKGSYTYSPAAGDSFSAIIGPLDYNYGAFKIQPRTDQDLVGGACDDGDDDGVCDNIDNCPAVSNPGQENIDHDSYGDACDADDDNDGIPDTADACPGEDAAGRDADTDGCIDSLTGLAQVVAGLGLDNGIEKSFLVKIGNAEGSSAAGSTKEAINQLNGLANQIKALTGKKLAEPQAQMLLAYIANLLRAMAADAKFVYCESLTPSASGEVCEVTTGNTALRIRGDVLAVDTIYQGGEVLVDETGLILYVGCSAERPEELAAIASQSTAIVCAEGVVSPGLINAHDHMYYNQNYPFPATSERYNHRNDWRAGGPSAPGDFDPMKVMWSEIRQNMVGTTAMTGAGGDLGFLRNLDMGSFPIFDDLLWDIFIESPTVILTDTFPLENPGDYLQLEGNCSEYRYLGADPSSYDVYVPHVAEGINGAAHNEFLCLSSSANNGNDLVDENFVMVHGIALDAQDGNNLAQDKGSLVWSPRSNISLYGNTAQVSMLKNQGVLIALSTDWTPSGSMNLGRELICADTLNRKYFANAFSDRELWLMVTYNPAVALNVADRIGSLQAGLFGDIAIYDGGDKLNPYRAVIEADAAHTVLVLRRSSIPFSLIDGPKYVGSVGLFGDAGVIQAMPPTLHNMYAGTQLCEPLDVCSTDKMVCVLQENWWTDLAGWGPPFTFYGDLLTANSSSYPLFFCEEPPDEPTCLPSRPGEYDGTIVLDPSVEDQDGDGILDPADNCPAVFNPVRPMDNGVQPDADGDGTGDACDTCPLVADPECTAAVP